MTNVNIHKDDPCRLSFSIYNNMFIFSFLKMEEEDTREVLLPNWKGSSGSMGLTLDQNDDGVYVKQVVHNSPAAKTGVVKEGKSFQVR